MTGSEFHVRREPASGEGAFACSAWGSDRRRGSALPTEGAAPTPQGAKGGLRRQRSQGSQLETVQPRPPAGQEPVGQAAQSILCGRDPAGNRLGAHGPQQSPQEGPSSGFRRGRRNAPASYGWPAKAASIRGPARAVSAVRVARSRVLLAGPGPVESVPLQRLREAAQAQAGHRPTGSAARAVMPEGVSRDRPRQERAELRTGVAALARSPGTLAKRAHLISPLGMAGQGLRCASLERARTQPLARLRSIPLNGALASARNPPEGRQTDRGKRFQRVTKPTPPCLRAALLPAVLAAERQAAGR